MRPTPETDAAELSVADYALTLDEARGVITRLTRLVGNLERERDEAREALVKAKSLLDMSLAMQTYITMQKL